VEVGQVGQHVSRAPITGGSPSSSASVHTISSSVRHLRARPSAYRSSPSAGAPADQGAPIGDGPPAPPRGSAPAVWPGAPITPPPGCPLPASVVGPCPPGSAPCVSAVFGVTPPAACRSSVPPGCPPPDCPARGTASAVMAITPPAATIGTA